MMRQLLLSSALVLTACGVSSPSGAEAQSSSEMTDEAFDRQLREALMRNPQVILEALEAYQSSMEKEALSAARDSVSAMLPALIAAESGHAVGASAADADLVIVEFFDYNCSVCRNAMTDVLGRATDNSGVRLVFQDYPVIREQSRLASVSALAAAGLGDGAFLRAHQALLTTGALVDQGAIDRALSRAGFDPTQVAAEAAARGEEIDEMIDRSMVMGRQITPRGTPFFIIANPKSGTFDVMDGYHPVSFGEMVSRVASSERPAR